MKILIVSYDYRPSFGGVATVAFELARALAKRPDVEIRVLAPEQDGDAEFDKKWQVAVQRVKIVGGSVGAATVFSQHLNWELLRWKPHAILNILWMPDGVSSFMVLPFLKLRRVPYFTFAMGMELLETDGSWRKKLRSKLLFFKKKVFENAAGVFAISRFTAGLVKENCGITDERIRVTLLGVDTNEFSPGEPRAEILQLIGKGDRPTFLTVARLNAYKGVDRVLEALVKVKKEFPFVLYVVCGTGPDMDRLKKMTEDLGLTANVIFTGGVKFQDRVDLYRASDCFILPTRTDLTAPNLEGFGLVFLEAAACGKPSIGANSGGIPDAIVDGQTGWLVDPDSSAEIAETMIQVIRNADERVKRGEAALKRAREEMTWGQIADKVEAEIRLRAFGAKE